MAETFNSLDDPRDWRGAPIYVGATVIYGAPVGRSIAMVEGTVEGFTKTGRVNIMPIRRAYGGWGDKVKMVHVGQDRVTIVNELPLALMGTETEKREHRRIQAEERDRIRATHRFPGAWQPCAVCAVEYRLGSQQECTG